MNKQLFSFFIILIALLTGAIYYNNTLQKPIIQALNFVKMQYHNGTAFVQNGITKHFDQAATIASLQEKLQRFENNHLVMQQLASEVADLYKESNSTLKLNPQVALVRTISYERFGDMNRIWLDVPEYNASKIYGLVYKELVAGIVIPQNGMPLGVLNRDIKSSYAVLIGDENAPGIAHGNNDEHIVVKYIPAWYHINVGDEVVTSGLDKIFFKGLKVGKVLSVTKAQGYQNAVVAQYYRANDPNYFHMIKSVR